MALLDGDFGSMMGSGGYQIGVGIYLAKSVPPGLLNYQAQDAKRARKRRDIDTLLVGNFS